MVYKQKLTKIGNSYGITIPKALRDKLKLKPEKDVFLINEDDSDILTLSDKPVLQTDVTPDFQRLLQRASTTYSKALTELAKK